MKADLIQRDCIQCRDSVENWEEAIRVAAQPLLNKGYIQEQYIDAMIQTVNELGAYIVIAPRIAMPHAANQTGTTCNSFAVLKLKKGVYFDEQEDSLADLILPLACVDNESHMLMLQAIATVLGDSETMEKLLSTEDGDEIYQIFKNVVFEQ